MQAPWNRTPFRLAVPVTGLSRPSLSPRISGSSSPPHLLAPRPLIPTPRTTSTPLQTRPSSSNSRWKQRQGTDYFAREARVQGLKSRAAFKLLELDAKYHLFRRGKGQVVVDLGFAPGSWSQVALDRTAPDGRVVGIDIIPAQPPRGVSTIQGNFLSPGVQGMVKAFLLEGERKRRAGRRGVKGKEEDGEGEEGDEIADRPSYIDLERMAALEENTAIPSATPAPASDHTNPAEPAKEAEPEPSRPNLRLVDVVLSDMSAPWPQTHGFSINSISNPHTRMMNTSGISFADHAGSMDLCRAALSFASDTLKPNGHFVCKFYQGSEDKALETLLKRMFARVHREKPESSRSESKEAFFVALRRKGDVTMAEAENM